MSLRTIQPDRKRSGQALVMVTFSLTLMLAMMSFAVDLGWGYYRREVAQAAADSASAAAVRAVSGTPTCGTNNVWCGSPAGTVTNCPSTVPAAATNTYDNACMLAAANGYTTSGSKTVSVQANTTSPSPSVPGVTVSYWVTVKISETPSTFFGVPIGTQGLSPLSLNVVSTAAILPNGVPADPPCMYILGSSGTTFMLGNGATATASGCGVYVNSTSTGPATYAASITGGARLNSPVMQIAGSDTVNNGGCVATSSVAGCGSLAPQTGQSAVSDPFATVPQPSNPGNCQSGNFTSWQPSAYTPAAGCYNGFSLGNGMNAILGAGVYYINGGSFNIQGGSTLTATSGVTIFLTNGAYVNIANGSSVTMTAQSSGTYEGILFFQDRSMSSPTASTFAGGSSTRLTGSVYMPNSLVNFNNGSSESSTMALVVKSVDFEGGSTTLLQATSQTQTGLPVPGNVNMIIQ